MISKKIFLSLIKENLSEMAMDFDTQDRPDQGIQSKLSSGDTPLRKVPLPSTGQEPNKNFQELLASERYKQVVDNLRRYTGSNVRLDGTQGMMPLMQMMLNAHNTIVNLERQHRTELENLAVELVVKEMGIPEGSIEFDAKIVGMDEIDSSDFNREEGQQQNPEQVNIETEENLYTELQSLDFERAKRRLINNIIQGASKRGHYMYHLVREKIQQITGSEQLLNLYGVMMSINDINYWQLSDEQIRGMGNSVAGKESVERPEDEEGSAKVVARGINFPVLVHEIIKGVMELFAIQGRPENDEGFEDVENLEDTLEKEMWDLRLGPAIWDRIRKQFPEEIVLDENKLELQNYLLVEIFKLPAKQFLILMKEVISGSDKGKELLGSIVSGVEKMFNDQDYQDVMSQFHDELENMEGEISDDDLKNYLGNLGINLSSDDEEDDEDDGGELVPRR